jgi:hemolysin III
VPATYTAREELANRVTHGVAAVLSVAGLVQLVVHAAWHGNAWHVVSTGIFGTTLVLLYTASTLYHSFRGAEIRALMQKFDHAAIFLLIAGSYTPFLLVTLRGPWGGACLGLSGAWRWPGSRLSSGSRAASGSPRR